VPVSGIPGWSFWPAPVGAWMIQQMGRRGSLVAAKQHVLSIMKGKVIETSRWPYCALRL
jgi:hypothetical protein